MSTSGNKSATPDCWNNLEGDCRCFSLAEIQSATNNFDDSLFIAKGGFGKVYKGFIDGETFLVAIKRLKTESNQGAQEFWMEINTLSKVRHNNLVALIGYCNESEEMNLVYEYMLNGTLADHLYKLHRQGKSANSYHLSWEERLKICIGAARGLAHLHEGIEQSIIHRDVKSENILLDGNWVAKVSDFGLSKLCPMSGSQSHVSTAVKGSYGYFDPEYFVTGRLTKKSDVYAFGVVLFEVLCARPAVDTKVEEGQWSLALWAQNCFKKGTVDQIVDPSLKGEILSKSLKMFIEVAIKCLHRHPKGRIKMVEVVKKLELVLASETELSAPNGIIRKALTYMGMLPPQNTGSILKKSTDGSGRKKEDDFVDQHFEEDPSLEEAILARNHLEEDPSLEEAILVRNHFQGDPSLEKAIQLRQRFSLAQVRAATNEFDRTMFICRNGYANVYKGILGDGNTMVSIKRWECRTSKMYTHSFNQFRCEMLVHSKIDHLHIVRLIGYCNEDHELILVHEYTVKGSLADLLHGTTISRLPWETRLEIIASAARGLQYLHSNAIMHRDFRSHNILLDENWVAKLSGLQISKDLSSELADPEYFPMGSGGEPDEDVKSNWISEKEEKDISSFGVVLLELLSGRSAALHSADAKEISIVGWFRSKLKKGTVEEIIDKNLRKEVAPDCFAEYVKVATDCVSVDKFKRRPSMEGVLPRLHNVILLQKSWSESEIGVTKNTKMDVAQNTKMGVAKNTVPKNTVPKNRVAKNTEMGLAKNTVANNTEMDVPKNTKMGVAKNTEVGVAKNTVATNTEMDVAKKKNTKAGVAKNKLDRFPSIMYVSE